MTSRRRFRNFAAAATAAVSVVGWGAPAAQASYLDFTLYNESGRPVVFVYVSPASVRSWGDDVLGRPTLPNGESTRITLDGPAPTGSCLWDVKFVYGGGTSAVSRFNLCHGGPVIAPR